MFDVVEVEVEIDDEGVEDSVAGAWDGEFLPPGERGVRGPKVEVEDSDGVRESSGVGPGQQRGAFTVTFSTLESFEPDHILSRNTHSPGTRDLEERW